MTTVTLSIGQLQGFEQDGVHQFLGVPYAQPLIGLARLQRPRAVEAWEGVRQATAFGSAVPQDEIPFMPVGSIGDDCLNLNVWTPDLHGKRPVMVWIHGGGYITGSTAQMLYHGARLAAGQDVVVVSFNYRLGILGFGDFSEFPELGADTNNAVRDQIMALEWVRDHIAAFGGDASNVTIFGESAGGMAVSTLLAVPSAKGLFHRAIVQSGSADHVLQPDEARRVARTFAEAAGQDLAAVVTGDWRAFLAACRPCYRMIVNRGIHPRPVAQFGMSALPVIDGDILPEPPLEAIRKGAAKGIALIVGTTRDEWNLFFHAPQMMGGGGKREEQDETFLEKVFERGMPGQGRDIAEAFRRVMPDADVPARICAFETDRIFRIPSIQLAEAQSAHAPTRMYLLDWPSPVNRRLGSCHVMEIPFVFGLVDVPIGQLFTGGGEEARRFSAQVQSAWGGFARNGVPESEGWPQWLLYGQDRQTLMMGRETRLESDPEAERRGLWQGRL